MADEKYKSVSTFALPDEYQRQASEARRRRRMAEILAQQAYQPGDIQNAPIPSAAPLVQGLQAYLTARAARKADEAEEGAKTAGTKEARDFLRALTDPAKTMTIGETAMQNIAQAGTPELVDGRLEYRKTAMPAPTPEMIPQAGPQVQLGRKPEDDQVYMPTSTGRETDPQRMAAMLANPQYKAEFTPEQKRSLALEGMLTSQNPMLQNVAGAIYPTLVPKTPEIKTMEFGGKLLNIIDGKATPVTMNGAAVSEPTKPKTRVSAQDFGGFIRTYYSDGSYTDEKKTLAPSSPTVASTGPLEYVYGKDGKPELVTRANAVGRQRAPQPTTPRTGPTGDTSADRRKHRDKKQELEDSYVAVNNFLQALETTPKEESITGEKAGALSTKYKLALSAVRVLQNTGVINSGEIPFLEDALRDPQNISQFLNPNSRATITGQINALADFLESKNENNDRLFGYDVAPLRGSEIRKAKRVPAAAAAAGITQQEWDNSTDEEKKAVALTAQQAASLKAIKERKSQKKELGVGSMLLQAGFNAPASAVRFGQDVVEPFLSPIETTKAVVNLGNSVLGKIGITNADPTLANQVGDYFSNRYGSVDNAMRTFAEDPVGMASDAAGLLTGGGAIAAKVPRLARLAGALEKTGRVIDPLNIAVKGAEATGKTTAFLTGLTSGVGMRPIEETAKAGYAGGSQGDAFVTQMRQPEKFKNVLDEAERAVDAVRQKRSLDYKAGMANISQDATVLDFAPVRNAFDQIKSMGQYAGRSGTGIAKSINEPAVTAVEKLEDIIGDWEFSDPKEFHTPEGFDALKKKIYNQSRSYAFGTPERVVADKMYNSVRQVVANQAPDYSRVMGAYEEASDLLKEFEKSLSLNDKATADTTLRKLQSILRNNANTNYGAREALGQELVQAGATNLMPGLAGQMMSSPTPRALSGQMTGVGAIVNAAQSFPGSFLDPVALALMTSTSPRVVGEAVYAAGQVAGVPKKLAALLGQYGDTLSQQNPRLAPVIASTRKAIAAGKRVNPVYAQQLALQLSRLQEMDAERRKPITQEQE